MKLTTTIITLVLTLCLCSFTLANRDMGIDNCENYYKDHGKSWVTIYDNCTDDASQQSPVDVAISDNVWKDFVFLTAYSPTTPTSMGMEDCVYRIKADNIGVVTTNDVYALPKLYKFEAEYIDFHSPSEHKINGTQADLEMQIYHKDVFGKSKSKTAMAVSVLFNKGEEENDFFKFLDGEQLDCSKVMPIDYMMSNYVYGYLGTLTSEGCANGVGWYISTNIGTISNEHFEKITKDFVKDGNTRESFSIRDKRLFSHPPLFTS